MSRGSVGIQRFFRVNWFAFSWRRCFSLVVFIALLIGALLAVQKIFQPTTLPIQTVQVRGHYPHVSQEQLKAVLLPLVQSGFFGISVTTIQQHLLSLPWIAAVSVRKRWPGIITVTLWEHQPLATWGAHHLVAQNGVLFAPQSGVTDFAYLPHLSGPLGRFQDVLTMYQQQAELARSQQLTIAQLDLSETGVWQSCFRNGICLTLGSDHVRERLQRFLSVYPQLFKARAADIGYIDMRYANGFAVKWKTS